MLPKPCAFCSESKRFCAVCPHHARAVAAVREWSGGKWAGNDPMKLTRTEEMLAQAGIIATVGCVIAILGLFTPPGMPLGLRFAYWIIGLLAAWIFVWLLSHIGAAIAKLIGLSPAWGYGLVIPLSSVGISFGVLWWIGGMEMSLGDNFAQIWPVTLLIGIGFFGLFYVLYERSAARASTLADVDKPEAAGIAPAHVNSGLHELLPKGFPAVIALSVEDHYVRAHARERTELLLISLTEASELMRETAGERVHRSWWVARSAVTGHKRDGRDTKLILENGLEVPVSRDKVKPLRDAGWLI